MLGFFLTGAAFGMKQQNKPIISLKEARKLLGSDAAHLTNEELEAMIGQSEQVIRYIMRHYLVHKKSMVVE